MAGRDYLRQTPQGAALELLIAPRSKSNRLVGLHGGRLKVAVTAPPLDGRANSMICQYIAELLGVPKSSVVIQRGHHSRQKTVLVESAAAEDIVLKLDQLLGRD